MSYPKKSGEVLLVNTIQSQVTVSKKEGMQVATVTFTSSVGKLGTIILSPVQPTALNIEFQVGEQKLNITSINFQAAFGLNPGQVFCSGSGTNPEGNDAASFARQIFTWDN